jgi:hypothetical protein
MGRKDEHLNNAIWITIALNGFGKKGIIVIRRQAIAAAWQYSREVHEK